MVTLTCPYCRQAMQTPDHTPQVQCPGCGRTVPVPLQGTIVAPPQVRAVAPMPVQVPMDSQQPMIFVNTAPRSEPRLRPGGWFSRSFSSASGVLLALLLFVVVIVGVPVMLVCGGCMMVGSRIQEVASKHKAEEDIVRKLALPELQKRGMAEISSDAILIDTFSGSGNKTFAGSAHGNDGRIHQFRIEFKVATFQNRRQWQVEVIEIDGDVIYTRE